MGGLALCLALAPGVARAGDAAAAQDLFEQGIALLEKDDWEGACQKFRASMEAEPSGGTALNLARCHERDGLTASAWAEYSRAMSLFESANDGERKAFAKEQADRLEPKLSKLTIAVTPTPGLVVERDDVVVVEGAYGTPVAVDPGEHTIVAKAEGYEPWTTTVTVGEGPETLDVSIPALEEAPDPVGPAPSAAGQEGGSDALVIAGGVLTGVGGAAVIVGSILGGLVLADAGELDDNCDARIAPADADYTQGCPEDYDYESVQSSAETKATASTILIAGGGAVAAGGIVLLIIGLMDDGPSDEMVKLVPQVGPSQAGLTLTGRF